MGFFIYDLIFLIVFGTFLTIFLIKRKEKIQREGILILYRTKLGIKIIDYLSKRHKKFIKSLEYIVIFIGYALMLSMLYLLFHLVYIFSKFPEFIRAVKIPPLMPLIPYIPRIFKIDFLPPFYFTYWIIVLAVAAISHEFCHGIFSRINNVKIKSTGFAFLGPFTGAFVEPDEAKIKKLRIKNQLAILSAGTFANILMTLLFFIIMWLFFISVFTPAGVVFNTYTFSVVNVSQIKPAGENLFVEFNGGLNLTKVSVDGKNYYVENKDLKLKENTIIVYEDTPALKAGLAGVIIEFEGKKIRTNRDLQQELLSKKPNEIVKIKTLFNNSIKKYEIKLIERPDNKSRAYLGIALIRTESLSLLGKLRSKILFFKDPNTYYKPKIAEDLVVFIYNLIWWIILINFSVALVNMLPLGIFDGGRVFFLSVLAMTKSEKIARKAYKFSTYFLLFIFLLLMYLWFINFFGL